MDTVERFAKTILNGFESYLADFQNITLAGQTYFQEAQWQAMHAATRARIDLYKGKVTKVTEFAEVIAGERIREMPFWADARIAYASLIAEHDNFEIAETFYNSVYCATFKHLKIRNQYAFVFSDRADMPGDFDRSVYRSYRHTSSSAVLFGDLLDDFAFEVPWQDRERDLAYIVDAVEREVSELGKGQPARDDIEVQVLRSIFFRNKGAYLVGKILVGERSIPIIVPMLNNEKDGIYLDTVLFGADMVSVVFSFTRSYFMVNVKHPSQMVLFLCSLMPAKPISELYSAIGFNKHGKTYYHRCAYRHMQSTTDQFEIAPGIKGMVMSVFTLPSYDFVFKIIKDKFTPPKDMTRQQVMDKYNVVKRADRAGRMADTQEFTNLAFARERFSEQLMEELRRVAPSVIEEHGKALIIKHVYVERRMDPLNLYLQHASDQQITQVMDEYGNAIKELASANIFPGDMLLKNFGVTRHGRVVFYDYDELCPLTQCNFRKIPEPRTEEEEFASEPWYSVGPNDIFPEEFRLFFSGNQRARAAFDQVHSDIYDARFWQHLQNRIHEGYVDDFYPYRQRERFARNV
ncbi:MAG: isocitrate dehydrogenase kinase/phosphatase [Halieaceae bacterium]|jgi:isocitrate dehydrogenase kinase/phosphatase